MTKFQRNSVIIFLAWISIFFLAPSFGQINPEEKLPVDSNVKIGKLENGLTYYIRKNLRPEKKVELRLVINAGSILEDDDQRGLAHFTEHMAFNGSKHFKKNDIVSFLQSIGVEFGADLNAYTSFDETVYILPISTEKKENVDKGFQILEDWASSISFNSTDIDSERGVVLEEERIGKGADERMFRVTFPKMVEGSKYATRLPIGKADIIKTFRPETIKRFYKDWYRPDLMAVVVVGDLDPFEAEVLIKKHFAAIHAPAKERTRVAAEVLPRTKSEGLVVTDKEATNHVVEIYYSYKKEKTKTTVGDYREYIIKGLFRNMLSQRLQELTQLAEPPFIYGASSMGSWARGYEAFNSVAYVSAAGPAPAITALVQENERARKFGFTSTELDRMKKMMMKNMERSYNERDKTESSGLTDEYIQHFLEQEPIPGIENEYAYFKAFLDGITLEDVNKKAAEIIPPATDPKLVIFTGPDSAEFEIPTSQRILAMTEEAAQTEIKPYEDRAVGTSLMAQKPTPGKITDEKVNKVVDATELTFSNGIHVILKPTDFKNDQVVLIASRFGGQHLYPASERFNAEYASAVVGQMGIGQFSPLDLRKVLAGKNASVSPRIGAISESVSGQCSVSDLETFFQLIHLYFTQPREDADLFHSFVSKQQSLYKNMTQDPEVVFQDSVLKILYRNHPWAPRLPKPETFSRIDMKKAVKIYQERFGNASGFNFVLVGKFQLDSIRPLLETYLGSLPASGEKPAFKDVGLRPVTGVVKREIRKGTEPKSFIRMFWNGETPYSESENLKLQTLTELLNIKIIESLREDLGGIYGGGMFGSLNKNPYNSYSVGLSLPCGPENVDKLIQAALTEIEKIKTSGALQTDLDKVKETKKQQHLDDMKENGYWARQLLQSKELGSNPENILEFEKRINAIMLKDLQDAAKKYLDMKNYVQIVLNPE
jgi:zinc protease